MFVQVFTLECMQYTDKVSQLILPLRDSPAVRVRSARARRARAGRLLRQSCRLLTEGLSQRNAWSVGHRNGDGRVVSLRVALCVRARVHRHRSNRARRACSCCGNIVPLQGRTVVLAQFCVSAIALCIRIHRRCWTGSEGVCGARLRRHRGLCVLVSLSLAQELLEQSLLRSAGGYRHREWHSCSFSADTGLLLFKPIILYFYFYFYFYCISLNYEL